jgi:DNA-binding MarR family transcriptional regulator
MPYGGGVAKPLELPFDPIERAADIWARRFGPSSAMAAVTSIMRAQQILLAELDRLLRPHGLTFARYEALVLLTFSRQGALPLRVIGQRLMVHPTSVTNTIDRLEKQGLVVRKPNPLDGRGTLAEITGEGRAVVERATRDLMAAEFGMGRYDSGQLTEMFDLFLDLRLAAGDFIPGSTGDTDAQARDDRARDDRARDDRARDDRARDDRARDDRARDAGASDAGASDAGAQDAAVSRP